MTTVTITRTQNRYRRSVNGAWLSAGADTETLQLEESQLNGVSLGSGIKVTWPDGVTESAYPFGGGACFGYAPDCIPANGRLSRLFAPTTTEVP